MYHYAVLIDRYSDRERLFILARDMYGRVIDIRVPPDMVDAANGIPYRCTVRYEYRGGRPFFSPDISGWR